MIRGDNALYVFGIDFYRCMALNDDLTIPTPDRVIGGAGPFDFSGVAAIAAVPMSIKLDNEAVETLNLDLSGAADPAAVTVAELAAAIVAAGFTDVTATTEAVTGRLHIYYNGTEAYNYMQVYGEAALLCLIGQGYGCQFQRCDTQQTITETPVNKDEETITVTDSHGRDTEIISDGYRKGCTIAIQDTANDYSLKELVEGGDWDPVTLIYEKPTSESRKIYFFVEMFTINYREGTNKEADIDSYTMHVYRSCKGSVGEETHERNWMIVTYNVTCTPYEDELGVMHADKYERKLKIEQYQALDVYDV